MVLQISISLDTRMIYETGRDGVSLFGSSEARNGVKARAADDVTSTTASSTIAAKRCD
jgi:hypothetical protein